MTEFLINAYNEYTEFLFRNLTGILISSFILLLLGIHKTLYKRFNRPFWTTMALTIDNIFKTNFFFANFETTGYFIHRSGIYKTLSRFKNGKFTYRVKDRAKRRILIDCAKISAIYYETALKTNIPKILKYSLIVSRRRVVNRIQEEAQKSYEHLERQFKKIGIPTTFTQKYNTTVKLNRDNYEIAVDYLLKSPDVITLVENYYSRLDQYLKTYLNDMPAIVENLNGHLHHEVYKNEIVGETKINRLMRKFQVRYTKAKIEIIENMDKKNYKQVKQNLKVIMRVGRAIQNENTMEDYIEKLYK